MRTLFDEFELPKKKVVGNPYHSRSGKYTDRSTAAKEKAEKRAEIAENKVDYFQSIISGQSMRIRQMNEKILELEKRIENKLNRQ